MREIIYVVFCVVMATGVHGMENVSTERNCKSQNFDNNPLFFSVINLTPDIVNYSLTLENKTYSHRFSTNYEKPIQPTHLMYHVYLNDNQYLYLSSSELKNWKISPWFVRAGSRLNFYIPKAPPHLRPWLPVYILYPVYAPSAGEYVRDRPADMKSDFLDFQGLKYLYSPDRNCVFSFLPPELIREICLVTFLCTVRARVKQTSDMDLTREILRWGEGR